MSESGEEEEAEGMEEEPEYKFFITNSQNVNQVEIFSVNVSKLLIIWSNNRRTSDQRSQLRQENLQLFASLALWQ